MVKADSGASASISIKEAAHSAGVTRDTVVRWCQRYGIGQQIEPRSPWRIDPLGLRIVRNGDFIALAAYQTGDAGNPVLAKYRGGEAV